MEPSTIVSSPISHPPPAEILHCADCNAEDPHWASVNRGVLICTDCCSIHRNLGRQVSQVRSLKHGMWDTPQLELVNLLHRTGSNRVWEHALLDPSSSSKHRKKPNPHDPVLPIKESFIKSKYVDHAFTRKPNKDDDQWNLDDLNRQLWSCVRTGHVDTTLRLLAMGADANYVEPDKGNSPLHVAAKEGQNMQVELLCIYGADPEQRNANDQTPAQVARQDGFIDLSNRLQELSFEVTNRLTLFLCGRKPDHQHNQHFLVPELTGKSAMEGLRTVRKQLQLTPNIIFEKLVQDVYDEVDRRETQASWIAATQGKTIHTGNEQCVAVFLPLNPSFSATRNQLRQKLAKYDVREFATLIIDVLKEARRRYLGQPLEEDSLDVLDTSNLHASGAVSALANETSRDYDEVADSTYKLDGMRCSRVTRESSGNKTRSTISIEGAIDSRVSLDDVLELKERITENEIKLDSLTNTNAQIMKILSTLQSSMEHMRVENTCLKDEIIRLVEHTPISRRLPSPSTVTHPTIVQNNNLIERAHSVGTERLDKVDKTCKSPFDDTRLAKRQGSLTGTTSSFQKLSTSGRMSADNHREREIIRKIDHSRERDQSREKRERMWERNLEGNEYATITSLTPQTVASKIQEAFNEPAFPDNLIRETENLTVAIRQLLTDAQKKQLYAKSKEHAYKIASLINQIICLIPRDIRHGKTQQTISALMDATMVLSAKCNAPVLDAEQTCHAAYSVAQAAKMLLMTVHS